MTDTAPLRKISDPPSPERKMSDPPSPQRKGSDAMVPPERKRTASTASYGPVWGRERSMSVLRVAVLAVDDSDNSKFAFQWFLDNVHRQDDLVVLVHCPEPPKLPSITFKAGMNPPIDDWKKIIDDVNNRTRKLEEDYESTCLMKRLRYKVRGESFKRPGEGIIRVAEEEGADIICLGTRGLGSFKRAILGSVSDYVIRSATCPVIVVPKKAYDGSMSPQP